MISGLHTQNHMHTYGGEYQCTLHVTRMLAHVFRDRMTLGQNASIDQMDTGWCYAFIVPYWLRILVTWRVCERAQQNNLQLARGLRTIASRHACSRQINGCGVLAMSKPIMPCD